ncbi:GumC family protein [Marinitoga lauensis]|uniref:GumC family protein n=1 Tax=Marinitoga lauensis TaxID=2201189 RepID=UPI001010E82B|nr:Wzz/FepE/Etk N-terminal domain-containing protein [Marinitoga lauensis]
MEDFENELTLSDILRIFKRRKVTFFVIFIITILITGLYLFFAKDIYEAKMVVETKNTSKTSSLLAQYGSLASMVGISLPSGGNSISTIIEKMKSDQILLKVIEKNNLLDYYLKNSKPSFISKILNKNNSNEINKYDIVKSIKENLDIQPQKDTSLIKISYKSTDPTLAASIVQSVYDEYVKYEREIALADSNFYLKTLKDLFKDVSDKYLNIQKKILDFQVNNKIFDENSLDPFVSLYSKLYFDLIDIDSKKTELETKIKTIEDNLVNLNPDLKKFFLENNESIKPLKSELVNLKIEYETLKLNSTQNPKLIELETKIQVLEDNLKSQINSIMENNLKYLASTDIDTYKEYVNDKTQLELLDVVKSSTISLMQKIDSEIKAKSPLLYEYFLLKKDSAILQTKYNNLKSSIETQELQTKFLQPSIRIVDDVYIPYKPVAPNKKLTLAIGGVLGIFLAILGIFMKEYQDNKIKDVYEFANRYKAPEFVLKSFSNEKDIKRIVNFIYINNLKKIGVTRIGEFDYKNIVYDLREKLNEMQTFYSIENAELSLEEYEENNIVRIVRSDDGGDFVVKILPELTDPDFILYEKYFENVIILIKEGVSEIEVIDRYKEYIINNIVVYMEK